MTTHKDCIEGCGEMGEADLALGVIFSEWRLRRCTGHLLAHMAVTHTALTWMLKHLFWQTGCLLAHHHFYLTMVQYSLCLMCKNTK